MIRVEGKVGISATVLADSVSLINGVSGPRFTTFEITYPRLILAELNTHRMLSKNSASSRAIPFEKMQANLTGRPVRFGQANPGMQDKGEDYEAPVTVLNSTWQAKEYHHSVVWDMAKEYALKFAGSLFDAGYHKQVYNRLTEPFQMMKRSEERR